MTLMDELLAEPAGELIRRKGFGFKALLLRYEELRLLAVAYCKAYDELCGVK